MLLQKTAAAILKGIRNEELGIVEEFSIRHCRIAGKASYALWLIATTPAFIPHWGRRLPSLLHCVTEYSSTVAALRAI